MIGAGRGLDDVRRGGALLARHPRLWGWIAAPFALTTALFGALLWLAFVGVGSLGERLAGALPGWLAGWLPDVVAALAVALAAIGGWFVFVAIAMLIAAPFNEALSEAVERIATGRPAPPLTAGGLARDLALGVAHGVRRAARYLVVVGALFALGAVLPVIGPPLAAGLGALATARFAAWDAYDAVLARRRLSYAAKRRFLSAHRGRTYGLGATIAVLLVVPGANLVALSLGAAGATLGFLAIGGAVDDDARDG